MKIIGHRGARGLAPENTIASLQKALDHGVDMIEFDVRVTKDGVAILHHDPVARLNGSSLRINSTTYQTLLEFKNDLATLDQALNLIDRKVEICLEVKPGIRVKPIVDIVQSYKGDNLFIGSKSQKTLLALHRALPERPIIVIEPWSGIRATRRARQLETRYISMNQIWLWPFFIRRMNRSGYKLMTYTLNNPAKARRWARYGLYGVVTDFPDRFTSN